MRKNHTKTDEDEVVENFFDESIEDHDDMEYEPVTRVEYEEKISEIELKNDLHQKLLEEMYMKLCERPQTLVCRDMPSAKVKTCTVLYNLGFSPEYFVRFEQGHQSSEKPRLSIIVHRPGGTPYVHYSGLINKLPENLDCGASVLLRSIKDEDGHLSFDYICMVPAPEEYEIMQRRIAELELKVERLACIIQEG